MENNLKLDPLSEVIAEIADGKMIVMVDDENRENEGDIVIAAEKTTAEAINFMLQEAKGLICLSLSEDFRKRLGFSIQVAENTAAFGTNFTISVDHKSVKDSGVTASARTKTILETVSDNSVAEDFVSPGYVFPLAAKPGGVLKRRGQTEGSVDIAKLAGLKPAAVICEIMGANGKMLRGEDLQNFCREHQLKLTSVDDLVQHRLRSEASIRKLSEFRVEDSNSLSIVVDKSKLENTEVKIVSYLDDVDNKEHLAIIVGEPKDSSLVRIHSECLTGDVFDSRRCDCGKQLASAFDKILDEGSGVIIYLNQEGRGIGLGNKLRAYNLQDDGLDTVDANLELGFEADERDYRVGAQILSDLGVSKIRLMTNNPDKLEALGEYGIVIKERISIAVEEDDYNSRYLDTKRSRMGHILPTHQT